MAGEGCSILLMGTLKELFPTSQFIITGILEPGSNAHRQNEFLLIEFTKVGLSEKDGTIGYGGGNSK